jgi:hypothetical protein
MAEKQFNIILAGDKTFEDNVKQSKEFYDNIVAAVKVWNEGGKDKPFADQDKLIADLKKQTAANDELNKKIKAQKEFIDALKAAQVQVTKNYSEQEKTLGTVAKSIDDLTKANKLLNKQDEKDFEQISQNTIKIKELRKERNNLEKQAIDLKNETLLLAKAQKNENLTLGEKKQLYAIYIKQINQVVTETEKQTTAEKKLITTTAKLGEEIQEADRKNENYKSTIGNYATGAKAVVAQNQKLALSFTDIFGAISAAGLAQRGIDLIIQGFRALDEQIDETNKLQEKLKTSLDVTGDELTNATIKVKTLAAAYEDVDADSLTTGLNAVAASFDANLTDVFANVEEGFAKGSNASGEFISILEASSARVADSGISLEQYFAIINKSVTEGAYSDKGIELIAEGAQKLRENTQATKDALAPLSESVKLQIQQEIAAGDSFKALQLVSGELNTAGLTAQETQTIIADVFGSDAEDAGIGFTKLLSSISGNLNNVEDQTTRLTQANLEFQTQLQTAIVTLAGQEGGLANLKATALEGAAAFLELIQTNEDLQNVFENVLGIGESFFDIFESIFSLFGDGASKTAVLEGVVKILSTTFQVAIFPLRAVLFIVEKIIDVFTFLREKFLESIDTIKDFTAKIKEFVLQNDGLAKVFAIVEEKILIVITAINNLKDGFIDFLETIGLVSDETEVFSKTFSFNINNMSEDVKESMESTTKVTKEQLAEQLAERKKFLDAINDLEQLRINSLIDGFSKEIAQEELNYKIKQEKYAGNLEALALLEIEFGNNIQKIRQDYFGAEIEGIERSSGLAELKITDLIKQTGAELKKEAEDITGFEDVFKSYFDISDETFDQLSEITQLSENFADQLIGLGFDKQDARLNEIDALQQANEDEIQSEKDKITELQLLAETQTGYELQRTQNSINIEKARVAELTKQNELLLAEETKTQQKLKNIQKIAILSQLAGDVGSAFGSLLKYSEGNPLNLINPLTAPILYATGAVRIFSASATAYNAVKKLRKGGMLHGNSHEDGGIPIGLGYEAEDKEFVINREDTARMYNTIHAINSGSDIKGINLAIQKDTGQNLMQEINLQISKDKKELNILKKQTYYLKKLVNLQNKAKVYVQIGTKTYEISQNGSKKLMN